MLSINRIPYPLQRGAVIFVAALAGIFIHFGLAGAGLAFLCMVAASVLMDRVIAGGSWLHEIGLKPFSRDP